MSEEYEEPEFSLISKFPTFEIRKYPGSIQARVRVEGENWRGSTGGFRRIAAYIFGRNEGNQQIAMTAPVHIWNEGGGTNMAFIMPSGYSMSDLPRPNDEGVRLVNTEGRFFAVLTFSGLSGNRKANRLKKQLSEKVNEAGFKTSGAAILAVYDNPTSTLPFKRRNEILLPIQYREEK